MPHKTISFIFLVPHHRSMSKVEIIERRIQNYQVELQKLKLQLKIAKLDHATSPKQPQSSERREANHE